ncbi:MAG: hypothetical protein SGI72_16800 [Planctomycetota bacterium]|nr:hypothetical protein [Planctomycetota bacterium]
MMLLRIAPRRRHGSTRGFTLVEAVVAATVLVIGVLGYVASVTTGNRLMLQNRETRRAYTAAQTVFAEMQSQSIEDVFANYNSTTSDDPAGATRSPGNRFTAAGVGVCASGSTDGAGAVRFPSKDGTTLREDIVDAALGMPRDLDGDGVISSGPLTKPPLILPVEVTVKWQSSGGEREVTVRKFLFGNANS